MSYNSQRRKTQQRITVIFGTILAVAMGASLILPLLTANIATQPATQPTDIPEATVVPTPNIEAIAFDERYLHPTGLFSAAVPTGYSVSSEVNNASEAQVVMRNNTQLSVAEVRVLPAGENISSADDLGTIFNEQWLSSSWREYTSWDESRRVVTEDDRLEMDFTLSRGSQDFIARQIATTDGEWIYVTRVVTPDNAADALVHVLNNLNDSIEPNKQVASVPFAWDGYIDDQSGYLIRYPETWSVTDSAPGAPTTISGQGVTMRVEQVDTAIEGEDAAVEFVESLRDGIEVLSVEAVEQNGLSGYRVAYTQPTLDGPTESGAVLMLNAADGAQVANLRLMNQSDVNLNEAAGNTDEAADTLLTDALNVLASFARAPQVQLASN